MEIINKTTNTERKPLDFFEDFQGNLKELSTTHLEKLKNNIINNGFIAPIFVWEGHNFILDGHQRLAAIRSLIDEGYTMSEGLPFVTIQADSKKEAAKYVLAYNSQFGLVTHDGLEEFSKEFDLDLGEMSTELNLNFPDLSLEDDEVEEDTTAVEEDDYEVPDEDSIKTKIEKGQVYQLGRHTLMCGDSTSSEDVGILLNDVDIDVVVTDPPYGINEKGDRSERGGACQGNNLKDFKDDSINYAVEAFKIVQQKKIKTQIWWGANYYCHHIPQSNNWLVWDKRVEENQKDTQSDCELAWVLDGHSSVRIFRHLWKGMIKGSEHGQKRVHPTQKPITLMAWCITNYNKQSTKILDLFGGSGSTLIACEQLKKDCYMMEFEPHYCQVIIDRWEKLTEQKAERLL